MGKGLSLASQMCSIFYFKQLSNQLVCFYIFLLFFDFRRQRKNSRRCTRAKRNTVERQKSPTVLRTNTGTVCPMIILTIDLTLRNSRRFARPIRRDPYGKHHSPTAAFLTDPPRILFLMYLFCVCLPPSDTVLGFGVKYNFSRFAR